MLTQEIESATIEFDDLASKSDTPDPPISTVVSQIISGDKLRKENAAYTLMHVSGTSDENILRIAKEGGIPPLVAILSGRDDCSENCVKYASVALTNLSALQENRIIMVREGIIQKLLRMLSKDTDKNKGYIFLIK